MKKKAVIVYGNPFDGLHIIGPFNNVIEAVRHANEDANLHMHWWVVELESPDE